MKNRPKRDAGWSDVCDELLPDDGVNPRLEKTRKEARKNDYKVHQLCAQVKRALNLSLSGVGDDPRLSDIFIDAVYPAPDSSRLAVVVTSANPEVSLDHGVIDRLNGVRSWLRWEIASAIHRKCAPSLLFRMGVPGEPKP